MGYGVRQLLKSELRRRRNTLLVALWELYKYFACLKYKVFCRNRLYFSFAMENLTAEHFIDSVHWHIA